MAFIQGLREWPPREPPACETHNIRGFWFNCMHPTSFGNRGLAHPRHLNYWWPVPAAAESQDRKDYPDMRAGSLHYPWGPLTDELNDTSTLPS